MICSPPPSIPENSFSLDLKRPKNVPVIEIKGYFSREAGEKALKMVDELLKKGDRQVILDFSNCALVNSPGIVMVMKIAFLVADEYQGMIAATGVDELKNTVFELAGIFPLAHKYDTTEEALRVFLKK